jgi:hypothetical protein
MSIVTEITGLVLACASCAPLVRSLNKFLTDQHKISQMIKKRVMAQSSSSKVSPDLGVERPLCPPSWMFVIPLSFSLLVFVIQTFSSDPATRASVAVCVLAGVVIVAVVLARLILWCTSLLLEVVLRLYGPAE